MNTRQVHETEYAIVGGGIARASIACHLSKRTDDPVMLYERGEVAPEMTREWMALLVRQGNEITVR